jgi:hypothetical protein
MSKPAQQQVSAAQTRFEELQGIHQVVTFWTHFVVGSCIKFGELRQNLHWSRIGSENILRLLRKH